MAYDVHETRASDSERPVRLIDLTEEGSVAPFAVREADGSTDAVSGRIPDKAEIMAWLEEHPVVVGIATGVLCFSLIAGAMSTVLGSDSNSDADDPVAGASLTETQGGQGSFSSSGSGGANFTSDDSKLSRSGAGKVVGGAADGETAAGPTADPNSPSVGNSQTADPAAGPSNLDQSAMVGGRTPSTSNGSGQAGGRVTSILPSDGMDSNTDPGPNSGQQTGSGTSSTRNPGPNGSVPVPTTTSRSTTSTPAGNPTVTTAGQTSSTSQSSAPTSPTTAATTPTTAATTPTTPAPPASLMIAAPGNGSSHSFETPTNFAANFVSDATQYCWTFIQSGVTAIESCSGATTHQLPARPSLLNPGLVTVRATATGSFGTLTDTIQISLYRTKVINNPTRDLEIGKSALRVGVVDLVGATQYCFRITQTGYDSGSLCYPSSGTTFNKHHPIWDSLSPGPLTVSATILGGGTTLAVDMVTIQLL